MSSFLYDSAFYSTQRKDHVPNKIVTDQKSLFYDFKSNRMTRKGQLIQEESMLRKMKAASLANKEQRESEIASMRIKYQLQELDFIKSKNQHHKSIISRQTSLLKEKNSMKFAQIQGCRTSKKQSLISREHEFPYFVMSSRK